MTGIRDSLAHRLGRVRGQLMSSPKNEPPPVAELLDVDRQYHLAAAAGTLRRITPHRFNPSHAAWLPVLHTGRGGRHYAALFSNTARAHQQRNIRPADRTRIRRVPGGTTNIEEG